MQHGGCGQDLAGWEEEIASSSQTSTLISTSTNNTSVQNPLTTNTTGTKGTKDSGTKAFNLLILMGVLMILALHRRLR